MPVVHPGRAALLGGASGAKRQDAPHEDQDAKEDQAGAGDPGRFHGRHAKATASAKNESPVKPSQSPRVGDVTDRFPARSPAPLFQWIARTFRPEASRGS